MLCPSDGSLTCQATREPNLRRGTIPANRHFPPVATRAIEDTCPPSPRLPPPTTVHMSARLQISADTASRTMSRGASLDSTARPPKYGKVN
jgi:hypothetical protein